MKKLVLITVLFFSFSPVFAQYFYGADVINSTPGSCTVPSEYQIQCYSDDPDVQSFGIKIYWEDGSVENFPIIPASSNGWLVTISDTISLTHQHQFYRDTYIDNRYEVFINGGATPVGEGSFVIDFSDNTLDTFDFHQLYIYDSLGGYTYFDSLYLDLNTASGINTTLFIEQVYYNYLKMCPQAIPFELSLNHSGSNNSDIECLNLPVIVNNDFPFGTFNDNVTNYQNNLVYPNTPYNLLLITHNTSALENTSVENYSNVINYYDSTSYLSQQLNLAIRRTNNSIPDTSLVIHIENPGNVLTFATDYVKNPVVGNGFFEFQPKPADHLNQYMNLGFFGINPQTLTFGNNLFKAYIKNSNDINVNDDTTTIILNYWEPCMGNNSPEIDLEISCSQNMVDSFFTYTVEITKQTCQLVPGISLEIHYPATMTPDTSYTGYYNLQTVNDSTLHCFFDLGQYEFYKSFYLPFSFDGPVNTTGTMLFSSELSCSLDTNGVETCGQFLDLSTCNQLDTANSDHIIEFGQFGSNEFVLGGNMEYFNCNSTDTLKVKISVPNGVFPLSSNLLNASFSNDTLSFDLIGSGFYAPFGTSQNLLGQNVLFTVNYSNNSDTTFENNTAFINYQMPPDICVEFSHDITTSGYFDLNANQFIINHYNNRYLCNNTVQEKINFSSNLIPVTAGLINPVISGNTLTFDTPDTSYYRVKFNYNLFNSLQTESFEIEYMLSTDTVVSDNFDSLSIQFPFNQCDSISTTTNTYSSSFFIAPLQSGTVSLHSSVLNCNGQLQATFTLPSWIIPDYSQIPGAIYQDNQLTISSTDSYGNNQFSFPVTFPGNTTAGTLVDIPYILHNGADNSVVDNGDTIHGIVVNSYDPNEKLSNQTSVISPEEQDEFVYEIHFQNDGNFPAYNISVKDVIDTDLDLSSIRLLSSKHPCMMSVDSVSREVTFFFQNIMLASSEEDSSGSQGVFQYAIRELPNVANGQTVENTAFIYFDFNDPIVTNTTLSTNGYLNLQEFAETLIVYPNPVSDHFQLMDFDLLTDVQFTNISGQILLDYSSFENGSLDVSMLPNGIYVVNALKEGHWLHQKVIVNH